MEATKTSRFGFSPLEGIILIIFGILALAHPYITSLSMTIFLGLLLFVAGLMMCYRAVKNYREPDYWSSVLTSLLFIVMGAILLVQPMLGLLTLTIILVTFFAVEGVSKILLAWRVYPSSSWIAFLVYGLSAITLSILAFTGWPQTTLALLGILFGVHLIFSGTMMLFLACRD